MTEDSKTLLMDIHIHSEEYLAYYRGEKHTVSVVARDGRRVHFPAHFLRPFVTPMGIHGTFSLETDARMKLKSIRRLAN